jgi:hypothetical protein
LAQHHPWKQCLSCHAGMAWQVIPLQVAANSSRTHHCSGFISLAFSGFLWLDASSHAASSMLWQFSLQPLP